MFSWLDLVKLLEVRHKKIACCSFWHLPPCTGDVFDVSEENWMGKYRWSRTFCAIQWYYGELNLAEKCSWLKK